MASASPVLNAYVDDSGATITLVEPDGDSVRARRVRAVYASYHRASDVDPSLMRSLKSSERIASIHRGDSWVRVAWRTEIDRRQARYQFRDFGLDVFEGDVDPVRYYLTETRAPIARPRRCFLDIETDSRVSFAEKEKMRVLCWAVSDERGPVARGVLERNDDDGEAALLEQLWATLDRFDQVCAWFGGDPEDKGAGFDFYVIAERTRRMGLGVDLRRWLWLDQLVVWRRMNQAESGDEKESMRLEDIAQNQLGEGKEATPAWVAERFGDKPLGALAWDLWAAGGEFRRLLVDYCVKDTELLRKLEARKGFISLFQSMCELTSVFPNTRGLFPTNQMDGLCLKIGRDQDYRFATKRHEKDDGRIKFPGAFVLAPRTVESPPNKDGHGAWTKEQAAEWRRSRGMTTGILRDVHAADFAGMYPANIITWNLGEETIEKDDRIVAEVTAAYKAGRPVRDGYCYSPGSGVVTRVAPHGIITLALRTLKKLRKQYSDEAKQHPPGTPAFVDAMAKSNACKVLMNSFYGVQGASTSRFFNYDVARSTTQNGVWLIKSVMSEAERRQIECIAGDTDSAYVIGASRDGFASFVKWLNEKHLPKIIAATGAKDNQVALEFEKSFDILVFSGKKRYCARPLHYKWKTTCSRCVKKDGKTPGAVDVRTLECADCGAKFDAPPTFTGKPEIKGLEYRRGDWSRLAREMQGQAIDLLVGGLKVNPGLEHLERPVLDVAVYEQLIERWRDRIMTGPLTRDEVRIAKTIKDDSEYKKKDDGKTNLEPQRLVAKILEQRGQSIVPGTKVEFVIVDGASSPMKVIPAEDFAGECDRFHLWDTLVYPPTQRLLEGAFPEVDWARYADVRPKKPRGRAAKVAEEQLGFALAPKAPPANDVDELAVPAFSTRPLVVRIPEEVGEAGLERVKSALVANPGARAVEIVIVTKQGEAVLRSSLRVSTGPRLRAAIDAALAQGAP